MSEQEQQREPVVRTFTGPSGRSWQVLVQLLPPMQSASGRPNPPRAVLRFLASDVTLELHDWPADWETMDEAALIQLARSAKTPSGLWYTPNRPSESTTIRR